MAWRMSKEQESNLAWIMHGLTVLGLSLATWLGAKVYDKVDDMYWLVKVHEREINAMKEDFKEERRKEEKENEEKKKEFEKLNSDYAILRENYNDLKRQLKMGDQ